MTDQNDDGQPTLELVTARRYTLFDWYWEVGGDDSRFWSSATGAYVTELPAGAGLTLIDTEENLNQVLAAYGLPGPKLLPADVHAERDRRMAGGFSYDFGDQRGTHLIRTTPGDMAGWDEVTKLAQAQINLKMLDPSFVLKPITIATGTGVTQVDPFEWQHVMLAASDFRQPIWGASFILEAMNPIPTDFRQDVYWTPPAA
jgi:hypothetical protein